MAQYNQARFDASFFALSDVTRRGVLEQLARADASITELADRFDFTLVTTEKIGRVRTCKLGPRQLTEEAAWISGYRQLWNARFDALQAVVDEMKRQEKIRRRKKTGRE
jgi:hypothetical protein